MWAFWVMWIWISRKEASGCEIHIDGTVGRVSNCLEGRLNVTFDGMQNVTALHLEDNNLTLLSDRIFRLPNLKNLHLNNNYLTSLPANVFDGLPSLTTLSLYNNRLEYLRANVFDGLPKLEELYLQDNKLKSLPAIVFDGLPKLVVLYLQYNNLKSLPANVFDGLPKLVALYLQYNNLKSLPANVFDGLPTLEVLYLHSNWFENLEANVFDGLPSLVVLHLHRNRLEYLRANVFSTIPRLAVLYLQDNKLKSLPANVFDGLPSLLVLYLHTNRLKSLPANVFGGQSGLKTLRLHHNQITFLPFDVFRPLSSMEELDLRANKFTGFPCAILNVPKSLRRLKFAGNPFANLTLPYRLCNITDLGPNAPPCHDADGLSVCEHQLNCASVDWQIASHCSVSCGTGEQLWTRQVALELTHNFMPCAGESRSCSMQPCRVDCQFSAWKAWSKCNKMCGSGIQTRERTVMQHTEPYLTTVLSHDRSECGTLWEQRLCNVDACPIDCQMSQWDTWSECSKTCGNGTRSRERTVQHEALYAGSCGMQRDEQPCNLDACPIDCQMSQWESWNECSETCGNGAQLRQRTVVQEPKYGGDQCGDCLEVQHCNIGPCPKTGPCQDCCQTFQVSNLHIQGNISFFGLKVGEAPPNSYCVFTFNSSMSFMKFSGKRPDGVYDQHQLKLMADVVGNNTSSWTFKRNFLETDSSLYVRCLGESVYYPWDDNVAFATVPSTELDKIGVYSHLTPNIGMLDVLFDITCAED